MALATGALGSGGPPPQPRYVRADPQDEAETAALGRGRLGILKGATSDALLFLDWRLLNGARIGEPAAAALASPCCGTRGTGVYTWLDARRQVPRVSELFYVATEREGPNYTTVPNCFDDAFVTAAATLQDRVRRYGKNAAPVRAWVAAQDTVFQACSKPGATLPMLPNDAPAWLRADRAYQQAAITLYDDRPEEAARQFAAIARDRSSPWRPLGLYLEARALQRAALSNPSPARFSAAHAAIKRLAMSPTGTYGRGELTRMRQVLEYNEHPARLLARLDRELNAPELLADMAVAFRDYMSLSDRAEAKPEAADWIRTIKARERERGLAHAQHRWNASGRAAWLLAALSLAEPEDASADRLVSKAERVSPGQPGWLTAQYHALRLRMKSADPATVRTRVEAILARSDLSRSDRNIFAAIRTQQATSLADFARFALRKPYCDKGSATCVDGNWPSGDGLVGRRASGDFVGMGADARAVIDRLPLTERLALAGNVALPRDLRLDIALTSYARAVQLQDVNTIDRAAGLLALLLPQLAPDWRRIVAERSGPAKRFAEFLVMAKIPSLRVDLADYERPVGTVPQFRGYWVDWMLVKADHRTPDRHTASDAVHLPDVFWGGESGGQEPDTADLTCLGKCGLGSFPLHLPPFAIVLLPRAQAERRHFVTSRTMPEAPAEPATSVWEETLAYARAHPRDPRAPEALYRLIRVSRWGGAREGRHTGRRAFRLLHSRYPASRWAKLSPYFYD